MSNIEELGEYKIPLKTGGTLVITASYWCIFYYFPGPDRRYNGTHMTIGEHTLKQYTKAWRNNFNEYQRLKKVVPPTGTFQKYGEMDMCIHVGGCADGVCLHKHHMPINTETEILALEEEYNNLPQRVTQIRDAIGFPPEEIVDTSIIADELKCSEPSYPFPKLNDPIMKKSIKEYLAEGDRKRAIIAYHERKKCSLAKARLAIDEMINKGQA